MTRAYNRDKLFFFVNVTPRQRFYVILFLIYKRVYRTEGWTDGRRAMRNAASPRDDLSD